jgi:hypothetical protein
MLAPMIFELLIVSMLFLLVGWATDAVRASWHGSPSYLNSEGTIGWQQMSRPRNPLRHDNPEVTRRAQTVLPRRDTERLPLHALSDGGLRLPRVGTRRSHRPDC